MSFPRYPAYKPSGVEWLGDVPEHWDVLPCRGIVDERNEKNEGAACQDYLSLMANIGIIPFEEKGDIGNKKPEDLGKCKLVRKGDFVINSMNYGIGSYGVSGYDGVCSPVYIVLFPNEEKVRPRFAFRIFEDKTFQSHAQSFGNGILAHRSAIGWDILKGIGVPVPSSHEQERILQFLDHETAKINALIAEQQRLIELLQEKRQAVISHAVTKGLNPDAPMKDSGVEWLGEVPEHWEVKKIKHAARMESGHTPDRKVEAYWVNCNIPWVSLNDTGYLKDNNYISETAFNVNELVIQNSSARILPERVVVFSRDATIGRCAITTKEMAVSQHFIAWVCGEEILPEFLLLRLKSMTQELERLTFGATLKTIGMPDVKTLATPVPPIKEQREIVDEVLEVTAKLDAMSADTLKAIAIIQERRSALISAAVTGQIDVRGLVPEAEAA